MKGKGPPCFEHRFHLCFRVTRLFCGCCFRRPFERITLELSSFSLPFSAVYLIRCLLSLFAGENVGASLPEPLRGPPGPSHHATPRHVAQEALQTPTAAPRQPQQPPVVGLAVRSAAHAGLPGPGPPPT